MIRQNPQYVFLSNCLKYIQSEINELETTKKKAYTTNNLEQVDEDLNNIHNNTNTLMKTSLGDLPVQNRIIQTLTEEQASLTEKSIKILNKLLTGEEAASNANSTSCRHAVPWGI